MRAKVVAIVLNWNGKMNTSECLESLRRVEYPNYEIIVVDNASTDGSQEFLKESFPEITLIQNTKNLGFGGGLNVGIEEALRRKARYVLCLNNDIIVDKDMLKELVKVGERSSRIGGLCPMEYYYDQPRRINCAGGIARIVGSKVFGHGELDTGQLNVTMETKLLCGPALFLKTKALFHVGLIDDRYFYGPEDEDIALRLMQKNYRIAFVPAAKLWHKGHGASLGKKNAFSIFFQIRNRLLLIRKYAKGINRLCAVLYFGFFILSYVTLRWGIFGGKTYIKAIANAIKWHVDRSLVPPDYQIVALLSRCR